MAHEMFQDHFQRRFASISASVASILLSFGCSDLSNRETVIERNIQSRIGVDDEEYENALLTFKQVSDDDFRYLADHHPKVRQIILGPLDAGGFEKWKSVELLTDESLRHLGRLHELESINSLAGSGITDEGLSHLSSLQKLNSLDLRGTNITGEGLAYVRNLEELDSLWLPKSLTQKGVLAIASMKHVRVLSIYCNQDFSPLKNMESLKRIEIHGVESGTEYAWLSALKNLDELLVLTRNKDVKRALPFIGQMDQLSNLSFSLPPSNEDILPLAKCDQLTEIHFADASQLTAEAVSIFDSISRLENLRLNHCQTEFVLAIEPLADKQTLHSLSLSRSALDDEALTILSKFKHLTYLDLNGTQVGENGCKQLYQDLRGRCRIKPSKGPTLGK